MLLYNVIHINGLAYIYMDKMIFNYHLISYKYFHDQY